MQHADDDDAMDDNLWGVRRRTIPTEARAEGVSGAGVPLEKQLY